MTEHRTDLSAMAASGQAVIVSKANHIELLRIVAGHFDLLQGRTFNSIHDVEGLAARGQIDGYPVSGNVMEEAATALTARGHDVGASVGRLKQALGLTNTDVHNIACFCNQNQVHAGTVARQCRLIADRKEKCGI